MSNLAFVEKTLLSQRFFGSRNPFKIQKNNSQGILCRNHSWMVGGQSLAWSLQEPLQEEALKRNPSERRVVAISFWISGVHAIPGIPEGSWRLRALFTDSNRAVPVSQKLWKQPLLKFRRLLAVEGLTGSAPTFQAMIHQTWRASKLPWPSKSLDYMSKPSVNHSQANCRRVRRFVLCCVVLFVACVVCVIPCMHSKIP